ncbi:hypothetical protein OH76DRAFT_1407996 [Lentinus brumalis]|uniref:Uncharacterized protein n=1 Tax=Lentinus brumalis TaxID=2498619 RepID=A0A371CYT0_9APHY|nr:hypothetical protein OH76DRAFT_1407996 [Polyporus brumalis]
MNLFRFFHRRFPRLLRRSRLLSQWTPGVIAKQAHPALTSTVTASSIRSNSVRMPLVRMMSDQAALRGGTWSTQSRSCDHLQTISKSFENRPPVPDGPRCSSSK